MVHDFSQAVFRTLNFKNLPILSFPVLGYVLEEVSHITLSEEIGCLCKCKSEINNVCSAVESHCLQAMKVVHHHTNGHFDWLIFEHQSVNPSREFEATFILSGKYKIINVCSSCLCIYKYTMLK